MASKLYTQTLDLARAFSAEAKALEDAFLKRADPRAVQGGDRCEHAAMARTFARSLRELACEVEDQGI
jgi:hypothetical protein